MCVFSPLNQVSFQWVGKTTLYVYRSCGWERDLGPTVAQVADREPLVFSHFLPFMSVYTDESPERWVCRQDPVSKAFCSSEVNLPSAWQFSRAHSNPHMLESHRQHVSPITPTLRLMHCLTSVGKDMPIVPPVGKNVNHFLFVFSLMPGSLKVLFLKVYEVEPHPRAHCLKGVFLSFFPLS